jgi:hypothetical protein
VTSPSSPDHHSAPDWRFVLALLVFVLLTVAAVQVKVAHRWRAARQDTVTDYYTPNKELQP